MKKLIVALTLVLSWFAANAAHIVGGEIEFITIRPGLYQINLIQYRDENQSINPGPEGSLTVSFFSNKDDRRIGNYTLTFKEQTPVEYTNIACTIEELETSRVVWSTTIELDPAEFDDEEGYYFTWDRCCRNNNVINIIGSGASGMQYILDIPPLYKDGQPFINSSPVLNRPLSDYACTGQLYYTSFIGLDPDGDSLSYRLATPLNTKTASQTNPAPFESDPKPPLEIRWANGYSLENSISGTPPLSISNRGLLTVNPFLPGLFVFSVIVEEWRYDDDLGESFKIGQVQRDFQMLVIDGCGAPPPAPELDVIIPDDPDFDPDTDILTFDAEDNKCFQFYVTQVEQGENISFRADPVNFDEDYEVFGDLKFTVGPGGAAFVDYCVPDCPPVVGRPFIVDFIVEDDICPLPQLDTVRMAIQVEPPSNTPANLSPIIGSPFTATNGNTISFDFVVTDADSDIIDVSLLFDTPFDLASKGMIFEITKDEPGLVEGFFSWDVDCNEYDLTDRQSFMIGIQAEDADHCEIESPAIEWVSMSALLPGNTNPVLTSSSNTSFTIEPQDRLQFDISATDGDGDVLRLQMLTEGFNAEALGVVFQDTTGSGEVQSPFSWVPICSELNLLAKSDYKFYFVVDDEDECHLKNLDTLEVDVHIDIPDNESPQINSPSRLYQLKVNEPFELELEAFDADPQDSVFIKFHDSFRRPNSPSLEFEFASGFGDVSSVLTWTPECRLLELGETSHFYDLIFLAYDNACPIIGLDTMKITFEIVETRDAFGEFDPPNVFTPNGDGKNDVFTLSGQPEPRRNMPTDNCDDSFDYIVIQDRSGKKVFESTKRDFVWTGGGHPAGTYYFLIKYTKTDYRGILSLIK